MSRLTRDFYRDRGLTTILGAARTVGIDHQLMLRLVKEGKIGSVWETPPGETRSRRLVFREDVARLREQVEAMSR